jgi:MATE family multidrug resistance protein
MWLISSSIGNLLGEKNASRAALSAKASLLLTLIFSFISSMIFIIFRNRWAYIFNDDAAVVSLVASILPIVALFQVFDGLSAVTGGILRARGKQVCLRHLPPFRFQVLISRDSSPARC